MTSYIMRRYSLFITLMSEDDIIRHHRQWYHKSTCRGHFLLPTSHTYASTIIYDPSTETLTFPLLPSSPGFFFSYFTSYFLSTSLFFLCFFLSFPFLFFFLSFFLFFFLSFFLSFFLFFFVYLFSYSFTYLFIYLLIYLFI